MVDEREQVRLKKQWTKCDTLREKLRAVGISVHDDGPDGELKPRFCSQHNDAQTPSRKEYSRCAIKTSFRMLILVIFV